MGQALASKKVAAKRACMDMADMASFSGMYIEILFGMRNATSWRL